MLGKLVELWEGLRNDLINFFQFREIQLLP